MENETYFDSSAYLEAYWKHEAEIKKKYRNCNDFERLWNDYRDWDWEDVRGVMAESLGADKGFVAVASLGLWDGVHAGGKVLKNATLRDAEYQMLEDCIDWEVKSSDGDLVIMGHHHDGTNIYRIRAISDRAYDWMEEHEYDDMEYSEFVETVFKMSDKADLEKMYGFEPADLEFIENEVEERYGLDRIEA